MGKWKSASFTISTTPTPVRNDGNKRFVFEADITSMVNGSKKSRIADNTNVLNNAGPQHSTNPICSRKTETTAPNTTTASGKQSQEPFVSQSNSEEAQPTDPDIPPGMAPCDTSVSGKHLSPERFWPGVSVWTTPLFKSLCKFLLVSPQWPMKAPWDIIAPCGGLLTETVGATVSS